MPRRVVRQSIMYLPLLRCPGCTKLRPIAVTRGVNHPNERRQRGQRSRRADASKQFTEIAQQNK